MPRRPRKLPADTNKRAHAIVQIATGEVPAELKPGGGGTPKTLPPSPWGV